MRLPTRLLHRKAKAHKGDFGHILLLAGSPRFSGAAAICVEAAMRSGAGLVTVGLPKSILCAFIKIKIKEVMLLPLPESRKGALSLSGYLKIRDFARKADVLAIGPGLGQENTTQSLVRRIITTLDNPMVIDADGLNALAGKPQLLKSAGSNRVITPHAAEMARLLGVGINKLESDRKEIASQFARKYRLTVVLKGHNTVVADHRGGIYINKTGNPGMATAGSGDVLTGMIAAFMGQGLIPFLAAKYAVYLHGLAGDLASVKKTQISLIASDIIDRIPAAIKQCGCGAGTQVAKGGRL